MPEFQGNGGYIERAALAANKKIWTLASQLNLAVVDINREMHTEEYGGAFERDGIHFSSKVRTNVV